MSTDAATRMRDLPVGHPKSHFFDGFMVSPLGYADVCIYACEARSYGKDDFATRLDTCRRIKRQNEGIRASVMKKYVVTDRPIGRELELNNQLNRIIDPPPRILVDAKQQLIKVTYQYGWRHEDFKKLKIKRPILSLGVFNQYLEYNPRVYHYNGRFILRPNPKMTYARSDTCHDLLEQGQSLELSNLKYLYRPGSCVLRKITSRTITDIDPDLGVPLIDYYRREQKYAPFIQKMERFPEMRVLEVDHDRFNQGKNTTRYPVAACLVTPDIRLDDIPEKYRGNFMKNSHVNMNSRYDRALKFLDGLSESLLREIMPEPVEVSLLGLDVVNVNEKRLKFGNGSLTNQYSAIENYRSLKRNKVFKSPSGTKLVGIIPFKKLNSNLENFAKEIKNELSSIGVGCEIKILEPYNLGMNGRLNQFSLTEAYGSLNVDCALIELPNYSSQLWSTWKNALSGVIPSQMITTEKMKKPGISFNTALGVASCLGTMPIGLDGNNTGVSAWIGMDIYSEGKKHIAAASTVCDAQGMLIGYPPTMICSGERLDDAAFESTLRIIMDGLTHYYNKENLPLPKKLGLIRDGQFFENPNVITKIENEFSVTIVVVDVKKQGAPKLAVENGIRYESANCGTIICGMSGGYIQTTGYGSGKIPGTPVLREVTLVKGEAEIKEILDDMFWLSKIHGGSTQQPGLPIPQAYAHKLAKIAGSGVSIPNKFNTDLGFL
jgi:hypothetical protein